MITTIIAVVGTLAGALLTGALAHLSQRAQRKADTDTTRRTEGLAAVTDLITALTDHRRTMWIREDLRLRGEDWTQARTESHTTRSAITAPLLRVQLLLPSLAPDARAAAQATYALRGAEDGEALTAARDASLAADEHLLTKAGHLLGAPAS
ncbi:MULTISPECIES: protein kilB [Streptomyces rochei group]|uniref:protein kilB n=1 Tax=Streptomyces rochei group TaxID=2867164 RepID=UPI001873E5DD|nr:protein kilB [Streptomyces vinaceusdrappus]GHC37535.1 hypothetical protein GCM10010308_65180 [Streptomyces vinaceusdrappus]